MDERLRRERIRAPPASRALRFGTVSLGLLLTGCQAGAAATGKVTAVTDGDTLTVSIDGAPQTVRLLGVDTPEHGRDDRLVEYFAREATDFTRQRALGRSVRLEADPQADTRDAFGRSLRYVYLPDGALLNAEILSRGYGHAYTRSPFSKLDEFRALERAARSAGLGLWAADRLPVVEDDTAVEHIGHTATVCGTVASARFARDTDGAPTFLNLGRAHPQQTLTVVIWGTDRGLFERPETAYTNRRVCVTGKVESFRGRPEITVHHPSQIVGRAESDGR